MPPNIDADIDWQYKPSGKHITLTWHGHAASTWVSSRPAGIKPQWDRQRLIHGARWTKSLPGLISYTASTNSDTKSACWRSRILLACNTSFTKASQTSQLDVLSSAPAGRVDRHWQKCKIAGSTISWIPTRFNRQVLSSQASLSDVNESEPRCETPLITTTRAAAHLPHSINTTEDEQHPRFWLVESLSSFWRHRR